MLRLKAHLRAMVEFRVQDLREAMPVDTFDLIACRNLAFTYFDEALQAEVLENLTRRLSPGGSLVIGAHERLPVGTTMLRSWPGQPGIFHM